MYICIIGTFLRLACPWYVGVCVAFDLGFSRSPIRISDYTGAAEDMAHSSLRFGMGRFTTVAEVDYVVEKIVATVQRLRDMR